MRDYSLVPVDYQPEFDDHSLVPVGYDPFAADGVARQPQIQLAQAQPQDPQQPPAPGAGQPDTGAPAAGGVLSPLRDENDMVDSYVYKKFSAGRPLRLLLRAAIARSPPLTTPTTRISVGFTDIR